tara:strand:- start:2168 stop:3142 length:975 start_codon:yes stop_codon:yes gene_type:complete
MNELISNLYVKLFGILPSFLNKFISKIFKKLHDVHKLSSYQNDFLCELNIFGTKFKLFLLGKDLQAHSVYRKLHKTNQVYEIQMVKILKSIIESKKFKTFLDVGAFMGYFSCYAASMDKSLKVCSIESNKHYCKFIQKSLEQNSISNANVFNEILSKNETEMFFHKEGVYLKNENKNFEMKKSITLDSFCKINSIIPEIIKIDVHGAEGLVLNGSHNILKNDCKIILLELHSNNYLKKFSDGENRISIVNFLLKNEFSCFLISHHRDSNDNTKFNDVGNSLKKLEINEQNIEQIFFDRDTADLLIFAIKKDLDIDNFDYQSKFL